MKLIFKQRFFSWLDSYVIYDENGDVYFSVKGQLSGGHTFKIFDKNNQEIGMLKQRLFTFLPKYEIYINNRLLGEIHKEFTFFKPKFNITFNNYTVDGDFFDWDYDVYRDGVKVSSINKEIFKLTDTYTITTSEEEALISLMIVLAIDSIKDQRNNNN